MRIYITGSNGFLAQKFCEIIKKEDFDYTTLGVSKSINRNSFLTDIDFQQLDLTNFDELFKSLDSFKPTHILHAAAMTAVEGCEENREEAFTLNVALTEYLAKYCSDNQTHLTFLSTDFVFDGLNGPYAEDDAVAPLNYYGETKVLAEKAIGLAGCNAAVLRTILVYGAIPDKGRSNLVLWAKGQLELGNTIRVVEDQWRMPTWVDDLANACLSVIKRQSKGVFHISGEEMMSIQEAVLLLADTYGFDRELISPISAKEIGQDNNRPRKTGFCLDKAKAEFDFQPTSFLDSLTYICEQLKMYGK